jgi:hypothetical protein
MKLHSVEKYSFFNIQAGSIHTVTTVLQITYEQSL